MNYLSVCSGVEAASQAWEPLGWTPVAFSEIEPFPCAVLASRFPRVPNLGDMSKIHYNRETKELTNGTVRIVCNRGIDLLVGGTPCQSFSVAGKRAGLEGASGLAYHYARLLGEIQPRWFVWENVPGALSSVTYGDQRDFNFLLQQFAVGGDASLGCRWDLCWRVLDTQYVRVEHWPRAIPQRRRRVFIVGRLATDGGGGCEVLLEPEGVRGHPAPRRVKGQGAAGGAAPRAGGADGEEQSIDDVCVFKYKQSEKSNNPIGGPVSKALSSGCHDSAVAYPINSMIIGKDAKDGDRQTTGIGDDGDPLPTLQSAHHHAVAYGINPQNGSQMTPCTKEVAQTNTVAHFNGVAISFKGGQSADGGLGVDEGACQTMQSRMSAIEPTVAVGVKFGELLRLNGRHCDEAQPTLTRSDGKAGDNTPSVAIAIAPKQYSQNISEEVASPSLADDYKEPNVVAIGIGRDAFNSGANAQMAQSISREVQPPITAKGPGGVCVNGEPRKERT